MATKLKNLKIKKVDFVDEGANPDAHIRMIKRKDGEKQDEEDSSKKSTGNILKRMFGFIGKAAGMNQDEIDIVVDEIQKGDSVSFNEKINEVKNYKIVDEMWDTCYALQSSLCSILNDEDMDSTSTETAMLESLDEFYSVVKESIKEWSSGKSASIVKKEENVSEADIEIMKSAVERLNEVIEKAGKDTRSKEKGSDNSENQKGDEEEMKIDKSKLTEAERAFLESIEKRCGTEEVTEPGQGNQSAPIATETTQTLDEQPTVTKSATQTETEETTEDDPENIYKGMHPAVQKELEELKKFREDAEDRELTEIAKKYAIIGKKEEELVPLFKSLRAAGGTAYNDMIAVLDQAVNTVEKSGVFGEIGKSGGNSSGNVAEAKIDDIAKSYMSKDPSISYDVAVAKAWENNPDIMAEYEERAGF